MYQAFPALKQTSLGGQVYRESFDDGTEQLVWLDRGNRVHVITPEQAMVLHTATVRAREMRPTPTNSKRAIEDFQGKRLVFEKSKPRQRKSKRTPWRAGAQT